MLHRILELGQDLRVGLLQDVREHVQAAAVRHAEQDVPHAGIGGVGDDFVEDGQHHVQPLDREPRLPGEHAMQEPFEHLDLGQAIEQRHGIDRIDWRSKHPLLGRVAQPVPFDRDEDGGVVVAGSGAVDLAKAGHGVERVLRPFSDRSADERGRHGREIFTRDAVGRWIQRRVADGLAAQRIELSRQVTVSADAVGKVDRADHRTDVRRRVDGHAGHRSLPWRRRVGRRCPRREELAGPGVNRRGIDAIAVVQFGEISGVDALELFPASHRSLRF